MIVENPRELMVKKILAHAFPDSELSEEPVPATPATGGDTEAAERQARAVKKAASALHRLSDSNPELLHGYQTTAVGPSEQHEKGVRLSFERDGEVLVLEIAKRFEADQIWVASPRLKVDPVKGATRDDEREIAQAALDAFEAESGSNELL